VFDKGIALKRWIVLDVVETFTNGLMNPFRILFAHEIKGAEQFVIGWMTTSRIVGQVLFSTPMGRLADRIGRKKSFFIMLPLSCASNLLLVFSSSSAILILSAIFLGFLNISRIVVESPMRSELVPIEYVGRWRGILGLLTGLVGIPAPIIGGIIWEYMGPTYVFLVPLMLELFVRAPIMITMPETLSVPERKSKFS
jgi:MFS family permease